MKVKAATHILGIDIAKNKFDVNLRLLPSPGRRHAATFANDPQGLQALEQWLTRLEVPLSEALHACLESTSRYGDAVAEWLYGHGCQVSVVNPRRTRHYAASRLARTTNDPIDAGLIADFCAEQRHDLNRWSPLPAEHRQLQELTRARLALIEHRDGMVNLLETAAGLARQSFQRQRRNLDREIQRLDQAIARFLREEAPQLQAQVVLADSIPGVGPTTAATVVAELPPLNRLERASQAIALFGLDPRSKTSGDTVKTPARLSKMGSRRGRRALYMPALVALRHNPLIRALGQRLRQRGRSGKYIVVAAMRKLLRLIFGVIKSAQPFNPEWARGQQRPGVELVSQEVCA